MSRETVDGVRRFLDAFNRRDQEALLALVDPDVSFQAFPADEIPPRHGHDGMREWWDLLLSAFPDMQMTLLGFHDFGDHLVARIRNEGRGAGSGVAVDEPVFTAMRFRDVRATWWASYRTEKEALASIRPSRWRDRVRLKREFRRGGR